MNARRQQSAAKHFAEVWKGKGYEKGDSQKFWLSLLSEVLGVEHAAEYISFEDQVHLDHTSFIDGYIETTHVLIEQKSIEKDLNTPIKQSDGTALTPFQQAKRYITELPLSKHPRWVVTSNFRQFNIYDMENPQGNAEILLLENLPEEYYRLNFLINSNDSHISRETEISKGAGKLVGALYDELLKQYKDPTNEHSLKSLNMLCVRLVFCLYAEDAGLFGEHNKFGNYLKSFNPENVRDGLIKLFAVLNTKIAERDPYMNENLAAFPYVNGGLFADNNIEIPRFNDKILKFLIQDASENFNWSGISPTIFGAIFESTLNPETRRSGGMHYTSIENIHKVIDPLFLDELKTELAEIKQIAQERTRNQKLLAYQQKLAGLKFLDPACGSGNFLTETYLSLRKLENEAIATRLNGQTLAIDAPIQVSIGQFYGIEINDFAVSVAKTALWIAEAQMLQQTEIIAKADIDFLPLKNFENIVEANALRIDWNEVVPKEELNYIMGNPPFVGTQYLADEQRKDMDSVWQGHNRGKLDYVTCWYVKAANYINGNNEIIVSFVSTNSIVQGEQATSLWKYILLEQNCVLTFAVKSFVWDNETAEKAHVHVVIVAFSKKFDKQKFIYENGNKMAVGNINGYLLDAPNIVIEERYTPIADVPAIIRGSQATDDGQYLFTSDEKNGFVKAEPKSEKYFKRFMMGREFINKIERWCLWMPNISPQELKQMPKVLERVQAVKDFRLKSNNKQTQETANTPWRFGQYREVAKTYIAFAKVSSERRKYLPFGFLTDDIVPGDKLFTIPNATMFQFGVLSSVAHMAWMRTVCGRMKSDYSYSTTIVYNNFPWCDVTDAQKAEIERTAQGILDARAKYPDSSLADLYDELTMPPELRKAHKENDNAVLKAYGLKADTTEEEIVAFLMKRYQELTK